MKLILKNKTVEFILLKIFDEIFESENLQWMSPSRCNHGYLNFTSKDNKKSIRMDPNNPFKVMDLSPLYAQKYFDKLRELGFVDIR